MKGIVSKATGSWFRVREESGKYYDCRLAGKLRLEDRKSTSAVVVGDHVEFVDEGTNETEGVIIKIGERKNYIIRKSLNLSKQSHILATNIDQAFIIATLVMPRTSTGFIDRLLVTAEAYSIPATIIFNKLDLIQDEYVEIQNNLIKLYES